jgi:hypothetical protein
LKVCSVDMCCNNAISLGYCEKHYTRFRKYGDPERTITSEERSIKAVEASKKRLASTTPEMVSERSRKFRATFISKRKDIICQNCGGLTASKDSPDYETKRKNKTCSKECFGEITSKRLRKDKMERMLAAGAVVKGVDEYFSPLPCDGCGGQVRVHRQRELQKKRFCSDGCRARWQAKLPYEDWRGKIGAKNKGKLVGRENPMWGVSPPHGKWTYYDSSNGKQYKFRSTWEATVALYFDLIGEPWEYEVRKFVFSDCTYTPDFYLPRRKQYIEVKGWMSDRSKKQIDAFRRESVDTLVVWGKNMYDGVMKNIGVTA